MTTDKQIEPWQERTAQLLGDEAIDCLAHAHVLVVGTGGVGGYAAEMLARAGVGHLTLIDADCVAESNINRQLCALHSTVGKEKVKLLGERFRDINPHVQLNLRAEYLTEDAAQQLLTETHYDFVVDAIDTIAPKCSLIMAAMRNKVRIVSSMGAGAKCDVSQICFADLWETYHCGLSKAVRARLKREGMKRPLPVVFSKEQARQSALVSVEGERNKKTTAGTISYMPAVFGCYLAQYVLMRL